MILKDKLKLAGIFLALLIADFLTKAYVHHNLPLMGSSIWTYPFGGIGVFHNVLGVDFAITHVTNTGAAWGVLANWQPYLVLFRCLLISALSIYLFFKCDSFKKLFPYALILSGALGNVMDYFLYGHVVDMFYFILWGYSYPVFNLADSSIFIGVCFVVGASFFANFKESKLYNILFSQKQI